MGRLSQFRRYPGFGIEDLVSVANGLLADRPELLVSRRTVRFYVSEGWIPSPAGSPKFARYPYEALAFLIGLRRLQGEGWSLPLASKEVRRRLDSGEEDSLLAEAVPTPSEPDLAKKYRSVQEEKGEPMVLEERAPGAVSSIAEPILRYRFGGAIVELPAKEDEGVGLRRLRRDIEDYLTLLDSSSVY